MGSCGARLKEAHWGGSSLSSSLFRVAAKKKRLPMRGSRSKTIWANMVWLGLWCATSVGCGGGSATPQAGALKDREAIAKVLPQGVSLESPVVPDRLYGSSSKNVEEALAS